MDTIKEKTTFAWLNCTQFFGALNDNVFKLLCIFFLIKILGVSESSNITSNMGIAFVIPFLLFSHAAGVLADRISKRRILVLSKFSEFIIMILGVIAFLFNEPFAIYIVMFLMSTQSAFFGPSKFGIIPELVQTKDISRANSFLVSLTFLAIIIGTGLASLISIIIKKLSLDFVYSGLVCCFIALIGALCSLKIKKTPAFNSSKSFTPWFIADLFKTYKSIYHDRHLFFAVAGAAYFLLIGAFVQMNIIPYGLENMDLSKEWSNALFLFTALGIGFGSYIAGKLSGRNIEFGIIPIGSILISISAISLYFFNVNHLIFVCVAIFIMGCGAGLFIVPLESFIQYRSPEKRRGEILAASNFLSFTGVLIASLLLKFLTNILSISAAGGFLFIGILNFGLMILSIIILPDFLLRFIALFIMKLFYKIDVKGIDNVPIEGPALLVSNHVSWVDALLLVATSQRRIRFMMERSIYDVKWLNPLFKLMGVIPIAFSDPPKKIVESLKNARKALDEGYMVCIFAEGRITRSGHISEFRKGFEKIIKGTSYPIIPIYIGGAWGSIFSYYHGKLFRRLPYMIPYPITIIFGDQMPSTSTALETRIKVQELAGEMFNLQKKKRISLTASFIKIARQRFHLLATADSSGKTLSFGKTLISVIALSQKIKKSLNNQEKIGILLPPSNGGLICNIAVTLLGKISVNINFTASEKAILSSIEQCNIKTIITSKLVLKKLPNFPAKDKFVYIEDYIKQITLFDKVTSFLKARFIPISFIDNNPSNCADNVATIIFSSGSTAEPKGIMLTHHNIISNIESLRMVLKLGDKDNLLGALPFFHSFGFTGSIWLPILSGFSVTYHANPLDSAKIVSLIKQYKSTVLVATPTFLMSYMRKANAEDFQSLKYVIVGAEKLKPRLSNAFKEKFGIQPLEGYGSTELSPMVSVNIPNVEIDGVVQIGTKLGSVGHPLPGITIKIVDPSTNELLEPEKSGLLLVKGPNVMKGYLDNPQKTNEVLQDGWYNTGDIAIMDRDGFITITDRLSRFSKIGGEMIPHIAIEEAYLNSLNTNQQIIAVTSIPDEKKGEQLVVLYTKDAGTPENLHELISKTDLPNLWKPKKENYIPVEQLPLLGSGKLDLKALKNIAKEYYKL